MNAGCDSGVWSPPSPVTCIHTSLMGCLTWAESPRESRNRSAAAQHPCNPTVMGPSRESSDDHSGIRSVLASLSFPGHAPCLGTAFLLGLSSPSFSPSFSFSGHSRTLQSLGQGISHSTDILHFILFGLNYLVLYYAHSMSKIYYNFKTPKIFIFLFQHKRFHLSS